MLKFPCLVLDHDDTVVMTEETINYPCFCQYLDAYHPGVKPTLNEYIHGCFSMGFVDMCRKWYGFSEAELQREYQYWQDYIQNHLPGIYLGVDRIIHRQKEAGGLICVVSHSNRETIERDYQAHFGILPDAIYGWDLPEYQRKPNQFPLRDIMWQYGFSPNQLLVVDDMPPGCDMARSVGTAVAFSAWGKKNYTAILEEMKNQCDYTFHSPQELEKFLFD